MHRRANADPTRNGASRSPRSFALRPATRATPTSWVAYCRERLAPHKTPRYWTVLDEFPLTPSGKVQKFLLRKHFRAQAPDIAMHAGGSDIDAAAPPAS